MSNRPILLIFFGLLIGFGALPAQAADSGLCRILAPRYEPKTVRAPQSEVVRWPGGGRISRPVAAPCPPSRRPVDA